MPEIGGRLDFLDEPFGAEDGASPSLVVPCTTLHVASLQLRPLSHSLPSGSHLLPQPFEKPRYLPIFGIELERPLVALDG